MINLRLPPELEQNDINHPLVSRCLAVLPYCYEYWSDDLKAHAIKPLASITIPMGVIDQALKDKDWSGLKSFPALTEFMEQEHGRPLFIKLSSRCPKDFLSNNPFNMAKPEPVSTEGDILEALSNSERTIDDLVGYSLARIEPMIHIYPFVRLPIDCEFRMFVLDGNVFAMSQYYHMIPMPANEVDQAQQRIQAAADFFQLIKNHLPKKDIVVDVIIHNKDGFNVKLLEINPYGKSDPLLFGSYENLHTLPQDKFTYLYNRAELSKAVL